MSKRKLLLWIATVCLLVALLPATVFAATEGWVSENGSWCYYVDGEKVTNQVIKIDGNYYGFDWEGKMYDNQTFYIDTYIDGYGWEGNYYRAKEGGVLYVNEWYEDYEEWYYYGAEGKAPNDFYQVGGNWYFFEYAGRMAVNKLVWSNDSQGYYAISADGASYKAAPQNGWLDMGVSWYYMKDGQPYESGVYEIGGALFGFDWSCRMYTDCSFYDDEYVDNQWIGHYYRAQANGVLIVNDWYQDEYGNWYYYGEGGVAPDDFYQIGSTWYFFQDGYMVKDQVVWSEKYQANYYIGEDGTTYQQIPETGWFYMNDETYYFMNGEKLKSGVYFIDGTYYGFNWSGNMYTDCTFSFYEKDGEVYYRAKANGVLYVNEWYYYDDYNYYYGVGGAAPSDFYQIGSTWYFFDYDGRMVKDQIVWSEIYQKSYIISADGTSYQEVPSDGWVYVGEDTYYMVGGQMVQNTSYQIDGKWYYFEWDGGMLRDGTIQISGYDDELGYYTTRCYRAKEDGVLYANEWVEQYGDWYYYGEGGRGYSDFHQVGDTWYFFENARMVTSRLVWSDAYNAYYAISADGKSSKKVTADGWVQAGEDWYYMADGQLYSGGVYKIDGAYYGFNWEGKMRTNQSFSGYYNDGDTEYYGTYRASESGKLIVNDWYQNGKNWYYYGQHGIAPNDFYKVGSTWYYFREGRMVTDDLVWSDTYQNYYLISADGTSSKQVASTGWIETSKGYYYIKDGVKYSGGVYKIDGAYYGFKWDGLMYSDRSFEMNYYDEELDYWVYGYYRATKSGALIVNNWYQSGSAWYYYGAGGAAAEDFCKIDNVWYFFNYEGRMVTNELVYSGKYDGWYVISASGTSSEAVSKGWVQVNGKYYYIKDDGEMASGEVVKIGGAYYGFNWDGEMYADTHFGVEAYNEEEEYWEYTYYRAKSNGTLYVNSWYQEGSQWYYYGAEGKSARGFTSLGGVWYYFDEGMMRTDSIVWDDEVPYAVNDSGVMITAQGWQIVDGRYVYVGTNGVLTEGWKQIGSSWYYFEPKMAANGLYEIDGVLYAVNNSGVCTAVNSNGIYDIGYNDNVYVQNGKVSSGWKQVGGSWYYFDPYMCKNDVYEIDGSLYVFDQNGKMFTGGWLYLGDGWGYGSHVYADAQGKAYTGVKTIGGTKYAFSEYGYLYTDTTVRIDDANYVVNESGAVVSTSSSGWQLIDGKYYYNDDGYYLNGNAMVINGNLYAFNYDGVMVTNRLYSAYVIDHGYEYMLLGSNGAALKGWQKYGGQWVYADGDGYLVNGRVTIDGNEYIFSNYRMRTGTFLWSGSLVTTNSSGVIVSEQETLNGWFYSNGNSYYYKDGEAYTGWVGDYYINDGRMQVNTAIYDEAAGVHYALDTYGRYVKSGFYERKLPYETYYAETYYAKAGGKLAEDEWVQVGSTWYYFSGVEMVRSAIIEIDGVLCRFDKNGKYLGAAGSVSGNDGWKKVGTDWYYIHAGQPVTGLVYIDGNRYIFDDSGVMETNGFVSAYDYEYGYAGWYYVNSSGIVQKYTGWKEFEGTWCYFNSNNQAVTGWFQDGGQRYYGQAYVMNDTIYVGVLSGYMSDGEYLHYFASNGIYQGTRGVQNGWYSADGEWWYFEGSKLASGYRVIGGQGYYFYNGRMACDEVVNYNGAYYYVGSNGVQVTTTGWCKTSEGWVYIREDGTLCNGLWKIGGVEYYFMHGLMVR